MGAGRAVWMKSKDVTVSCELNWLPGRAAKAPIPRLPCSQSMAQHGTG